MKGSKDSDDSQDSKFSSPASPNKKGRNPLVYVVAVVLVVAVVGIAYYLFTYAGSQASTQYNFSNTTGLNPQQLMFVNDLAKTKNLSAISVSYIQSASNQIIPETASVKLLVTDKQTINSYELGNQSKSILFDNLSYTDLNNGTLVSRNLTTLYYYNTTSATITCFNQTTYISGVNNNTLQCAKGNADQGYLDQFPSTLKNVSYIAYLVNFGNLTYGGTQSIAGRSCDKFVISNATATNPLSNYSTFSMCIDKAYGIPLYYNETDISGGMVNYTVSFTARNISTYVPQSEFVIPPVYLSNAT